MKKYVVSYNSIPVYVAHSRQGAYSYIVEKGGDPIFDIAWSVKPVESESFANHVKRMMVSIGMTLPDPEEAQDWTVSEAGEMIGARQGMKAKWRRNNPEKHADDNMFVEAADVFMMASLSVPSDQMTVEEILLNKFSKKGFQDIELPRFVALPFG